VPLLLVGVADVRVWLLPSPVQRGEPHAGREYVQPQWVLDSINAKALLPVDLYGVGKPLPVRLGGMCMCGSGLRVICVRRGWWSGAALCGCDGRVG
jgi:hypothetical protein